MRRKIAKNGYLDSAKDYIFTIDSPLDIEMTWLPYADDLSEEIKDKVHRVATLAEKPDFISGQRSSIMALEDVIHDWMQGIQIKGHFFRDAENTNEIRPPNMLIYLGRGHPLMQLFAETNGNIIWGVLHDEPRGPLLKDLAEAELNHMADMTDANLPVVRPLGTGKIKGMQFCIADSLRQEPSTYSEELKWVGFYNNQQAVNARHDVYCLLVGVPGPDFKRAAEQLIDYADGMSKKQKKIFLKDFYRTYGRTMAMFFDEGFVLGNPHLDNASIVPVSQNRRGNTPNRFSSMTSFELIMHDPGIYGVAEYKKQEFTPAQWSGYVVIDVTNATELLQYFFDAKEYFYHAEREVDESRRPMLQRCKKLWQVSQDAGGYNPTEAFFEGLLGSERKKLPANFFDDRTKSDITTQLRMAYTNPMMRAMAMATGQQPNYLELLTKVSPIVKVIRDRFG